MSIKTVDDRRLSLWQSALQSIVKKTEAGVVEAGSQAHQMLTAAGEHVEAVFNGKSLPDPDNAQNDVSYCAKLSFDLADAKTRLLLAKTDDEKSAAETLIRESEERLQQYTTCDARWSETVTKYLDYYEGVIKGAVPYRRWSSLDDFVIPNILPDVGTVALIADWGTGTQAAINVLDQVATYNPDVVIHLGDIYYSGTSEEMHSCFLGICRSNLKADVPLYTIPGNHDMYSGGHGYYDLIDQLNQPASYFCLRNSNWQFLAMDTGLNDHDPLTVSSKWTSLDEKEVDWHLDKINNSGGRGTVLLSHHQPFSAFGKTAGQTVNEQLLGAFSGVLDQVALWLWGHEHALYVYKEYRGVKRGRCIGHGAVPVTVETAPFQVLDGCDIAVEPVTLSNDGAVYSNGYAIVKLDGPSATISYYQYPDPENQNPLFSETITKA